MREITYKNKITGAEITLNEMKEWINNGNVVLKVYPKSTFLSSINHEMIDVKEYIIKNIPFSSDWELVVENQFTQGELRYLMNIIRSSQEYYQDSEAKILLDKIFKIHKDKEIEKLQKLQSEYID